MGSGALALTEINAETAFQLLRHRGATSALWFLWVLKEGRKRPGSSGPPSKIAVWMTRGLVLSPVPSLSTCPRPGDQRAIGANKARVGWPISENKMMA